MKKIILSIMILLLMGWITITFAVTGIYITTNGGWINQTKLPNRYFVKMDNIQKNNLPAIRFGAGYLYDFNEIFGIGFEAGQGFYAKNFHRFNESIKIDIDISAAEFLFVTETHFKKIDFFGKIGGNRNTTGIKKTGGNSCEQTRIQPLASIGIAYNFNPHLAMMINYIHSFGDHIESFSDESWRCPSINAILGGLRITFW